MRTSHGTRRTCALHEICRRVDHLPLAVELVAGGARMFSPSALVERLESSLDAPSTGRRDAPARQQTVRAAIDWSYWLLNEHERDLFERLGVFAGSFTIEAAGSLAGEKGLAVLDALHSSTRACSCMRRPVGDPVPHASVVSEYAAERLRARADEDDICVAHSEYYEELARAAYAGQRATRLEGNPRLRRNENVRRALAHLARSGRVDETADLVWSVWVYWLTGHILDGPSRGRASASRSGASRTVRGRLARSHAGAGRLRRRRRGLRGGCGSPRRPQCLLVRSGRTGTPPPSPSPSPRPSVPSTQQADAARIATRALMLARLLGRAGEPAARAPRFAAEGSTQMTRTSWPGVNRTMSARSQLPSSPGAPRPT